MKKIIFSLSTLLASAVLFTGCLKDKGYENQEYGIKDPAGMSLGISIPESNEKDFAIDAKSTSQTLTMFNVNLESDQVATTDIHVNLVQKPTLVADYNAANGTTLVALPATQHTVVTYKVTIPKGSRLGNFQITVPNASLIDATQSFGMGLSIASIDEAGYTIASNLKDILVKISVKNKYDGVYRLRCKMLDWSAYNIGAHIWTWPNPDGIYMITSGPASVKMFDNWGFGTYIHPAIQVNQTTATGFGQTAPKFVFDPANDKLIDCINDFSPITNGRAFRVNPAVTTSRWDAATKTIYAAIILSQPGRPDLQIFDTLYYEGPR